jgi:phosphoserine phosphatase RsbU/P
MDHVDAGTETGRAEEHGDAGTEERVEHEIRIDSLTRNLLDCYEELDLIYRLSRRGLSALDAQDNVAFILEEAMEIFEADAGWLMALGTEPVFRPVAHGISCDAASAIEGAVVSRIVAAGKSRLFYDLKDEMGPADPGLGTFVCSVLKTERTVFGALCVGRQPGRSVFTAGDLKLADVLASQAAIGLENATLHRRRIEERESIVRMQEELRLARSIQDRLLPKHMPSVEGYEVAGCTIPAQSVGGDYFDFIPRGGEELALCLGDVSGKGMPAALLMAYLQAAIRGQTLQSVSPAECLARSNRLLFQSTDSDRFATCFYGVLDSGRHSLRYANAGHDRPVLVSSLGKPMFLEEAGLVLGLLEESGYEDVSVPLAPGEALVVYSDGIIDAADGQDLEFGRDRLLDLLAGLRGAPADVLLDRIVGEVRRHSGDAPQTDDMTVIVVRRKG